VTALLARARQVTAATLFPPGFAEPSEHATLDALIAATRALAAREAPGRPIEFVPGRAAYPGYDDFAAITVRAGGAYLATVADRWTDDGDLRAALAVLRRAFA
jgi:hypothetical protein